MAARLLAEELEVLEVIRAAGSGEMMATKVAEHFRGKKTHIRVFNLLDSLYQKGWLVTRWPYWYMLHDKTPTD